MSNVRHFKNREPKRINLLKWFFTGAIIGTILGIILTIYSWVDSGILSISFTILVICAVLGGFISLSLRKWILRTFWL